MSFETVQAYFERFGMADRCMDLKESSATVALAALALGTEEARIAKTLSFLVGEVPVVIVTAGDARIDNHKYKMLSIRNRNDSRGGMRKVYRPSARRGLSVLPSVHGGCLS